AGSVVLAAAIRRADLEAQTAVLTAAGLRPARLEPAPLPAGRLVAAPGGELAPLGAGGARSPAGVPAPGPAAAPRRPGAPGSAAPGLAAEVRWSLAAAGGAARIVVPGADGGGPVIDAIAEATGLPIVPLADVSVPLARDQETLAACAVVAGVVAGTSG